MARAQTLGRRRFQDRPDFVGERGLLEQERGLGARLDFDAFAFAQAGQGLQRLADEDDAALGFLLLGQKIGQFLLGRFVRFQIFARRGHGK
jgi:hypothetical protein